MRPGLRAARVTAVAAASVALLAACSGPTELTWEEHCEQLRSTVVADVAAPARWSVVVDRDDEPSGARGASYAVLPEGCPVEGVDGDLQAFVVGEGGPTS